MQITVNPSDELPIYRQMMRQIIEAIAGGRLKAGEKLPSHRELSERIVVAPLTVKKAYDELEALGFLETQRGRGTFVCLALPEIDREDQLQRIRQDGRKLLSQAHLAGLRFSELVDLLRSANRELTGGARDQKETV
ncbi:MAG TPA: GntR family transcriptional regulator [Bryobacteraceae bacterium]|nr:GntR family transcriptional regulator [Bryobacteraceae bacterium]